MEQLAKWWAGHALMPSSASFSLWELVRSISSLLPFLASRKERMGAWMHPMKDATRNRLSTFSFHVLLVLLWIGKQAGTGNHAAHAPSPR